MQALQAALARVGIQLQLHGYPSGTYYTDFAGSPNYVHQHDLGVLMGGWSPDWPDGYGMMDELINGNTIVPSGNTNIGELNDPTINSLFAQANEPDAHPGAARGHLRRDRQGDAMAQAVILPNVYAKPAVPEPGGDQRVHHDAVRDVQLRRHGRQQLAAPASDSPDVKS